MATKVNIDSAAVRRLASDPDIVHQLESSGLLEQIVEEMRRLAPRDSGEGADSINFERDPSGDFYRVSWDEDHFYMYFVEVGTEDTPPQPFMRPVVDRYNR